MGTTERPYDCLEAVYEAKECYYILNLDINNIRNNLRYYNTLKKLELTGKIKWVLNENIENNKNFKDQGAGIEKLSFTADEFESNYFKLTAKIPSVPKVVFLNRIYNGTPVVLDEGVSYTKDVKKSLLSLANEIWPIIYTEEKTKKSGGFLSSLFSKKEKPQKTKPKKVKSKKKRQEEEDDDDEE